MKFIVIEGLDGAGTTTQARRLTERLAELGHGTLLTREPSDGPIGVLIRQMLSMRVVSRAGGNFVPINRESLALLFAADRLDHIQNEIIPALQDKKFVVTDRYYHSSFVYQGDIDESDHFDIQWVKTLNERALKPDITFFVEADVELCLSRISRRNQTDIYESREKLSRLHTRYAQVFDALENAGERVVRLDASLPIQTLHEQILDLVLT
jgi:dTMP kinase